MSPAAQWAYNHDPKPVSPLNQDGTPSKWFDLNLPPDYPTLSTTGKILARLNGTRLHITPDHFVRAWVLFRTYYLKQLPDGVFYKNFKASPKCHYDAVRDLATYQFNAWAFPRGTGKSTVMGIELPMLLAYARPHYSTLMVLAKDDFVQKRFSRFMRLMEENPFLLQDWGAMRPPRGARVWNHHLLQMSNGSELTGLPVEGRMLGERPDLILPDDPEHDKPTVANPNTSAVIEAFERLMFGTLMPMMHEGSCFGWIGTLLDARSFLYHVMHSRDPRYRFWNRRLLEALTETGGSIWEAKWSRKDLEELRQKMGEEFFQTHMQNNPGTSSTKVITIHDSYCQYSVENEDNQFVVNPLQSNASLISVRPVKGTDGTLQPEESVRPYGETVRNMFRMLTVDFAYTVGRRSDYSCAHVLGVENSGEYHDTLWSLDMWLGKEKPSQVIDIILRMAQLWRVHVIAPESAGAQQQLVDQIAPRIEELLRENDGWVPRVCPIRPPSNLDKGQRIAGLQWRFEKFRVKLPMHRRATWPYRELYKQILNFTIDLKRLRHDDAIDTLAMHQWVGRPKSKYRELDAGELGPIDIIEEIKKGETHHHATGVGYLDSLSSNEIPLADLRERWQQDQEYTEEQDNGCVWMSA